MRVLVILLLLGAPAMAKETPMIPQSKLGAVTTEPDDEFEKILDRLDAGDERAWDDMQTYSVKTKARNQVYKQAPKAEKK